MRLHAPAWTPATVSYSVSSIVTSSSAGGAASASNRTTSASVIGLALEPGKPNLASVVASCRMYLRRYDEAEQLVLEAFSETPDDTTFARSFVGAMRSGDASLVPPELNTSNSFPEVWLVVGDTASAFEAMESVLFNPPFTVPYLVWQPDLDSLHDDPRYLDIMRRLDLEGRQPIRTER